MNRFNHSIATASTSPTNRLVCSGENDCAVKSMSDFLSSYRGAEEEDGVGWHQHTVTAPKMADGVSAKIGEHGPCSVHSHKCLEMDLAKNN